MRRLFAVHSLAYLPYPTQLYNALLPILVPSSRNEKLGILSSLVNKDKSSFLLGLHEGDPNSVPPRVYVATLPADLKLHLILYQVRTFFCCIRSINAHFSGTASLWCMASSIQSPMTPHSTQDYLLSCSPSSSSSGLSLRSTTLGSLLRTHRACINQQPYMLWYRPAEEGHRYIYYNHMNLAVKTSVKNRQLFASAEVIRTLNQLHADFERCALFSS